MTIFIVDTLTSAFIYWNLLENDLLLFPHHLLTLDCKPLIKRAISAIIKHKGLLPYIEAVLLTMEFKTLWDSEKELTKDFDNQLVQTIDSQSESLGVGFLFPEIQRQKCLRRTEGIQISSQRQIWKRWKRTGTERDKELNDQGNTVDQLSVGKSVRLSAIEWQRGSPLNM